MKKLCSFLLMAALLLSLSTVAYADVIRTADRGWLVHFTQGKRMESNFSMQDFQDVLKGMQPGDECDLTVRVRNDNSSTTDWYLQNDVIQSLEDESNNVNTAGGGYTYRLAYVGPDGQEDVYFDSESIGGDDTSGGEGLNQAATAMENYRFMDTLATGDSGTVTLHVELDGVTQGNDYQDTIARLSLSFATLLRDNDTTSTPPPRDIVRTGDESDLFLYVGVFGVSGVFVLLLAVYALSVNRKKKKGEEKK